MSLGLFLFYPTICSAIFSLMQCRSLSDNESWLRADMSISCEASSAADSYSGMSAAAAVQQNEDSHRGKDAADRYLSFLHLAYVLAVLIPFGVPLALGLHFFREARKDRKEFVEQTEMIIQDSDDDLMTSTQAGAASDPNSELPRSVYIDPRSPAPSPSPPRRRRKAAMRTRSC